MSTISSLEPLASMASVLLGAFVALVGARIERRAAEARDRRERLERAVRQLVVQSNLLDIRAHQVITLAANTGGVPGAVMRVVGAMAPTNMTELMEILSSTAERLYEAETEIAVLGDMRTASAAERVSQAAGRLMSAHHQEGVPTSLNLLRIALTGQRFEQRSAVSMARDDLAEAREELLGLLPIDGRSWRERLRLRHRNNRGVAGPSDVGQLAG